jgi:hypothetical protein
MHLVVAWSEEQEIPGSRLFMRDSSEVTFSPLQHLMPIIAPQPVIASSRGFGQLEYAKCQPNAVEPIRSAALGPKNCSNQRGRSLGVNPRHWFTPLDSE